MLAEDSGGMAGEGKDRQYIEESFSEDLQEGDNRFNKWEQLILLLTKLQIK